MEREKTDKEKKKDELKKKKLEKFMQKQEKIKSTPSNQNEDKKEIKKKIVQTEAVTYDILTKKGDKKDTSIPLPDSYSPLFVEAAWYDWWELQNLFKPEINGIDSKTKFIMSLPPPNVTGTLHLGHALTTAIQDTLTRWHRMKGHTTLWIPGSDHAGIATQVIVEKQLMRERGLTRHDLGRDNFIKEVLVWKQSKGNQIAEQERALGASLDWSREYFTKNENFSSAVAEAFVTLHERGLIYRSDRLVNWSCALKSAISDIEVEKREIAGKTLLKVPNYDRVVEFGTLTHFAYKIDGMPDTEIVVATTRLETMLGDTGIAVHPSDPRYLALHGRFAVHPFNDSKIPIVADTYVDLDFGTGAVKITPAHDFNDCELGGRHNLPVVNILTEDGHMNDNCGQFEGLHRFAARYEIQGELERLGLFRGKQDHQMIIPICSRSKDIVEPMLKPQWYLNCQDMAVKAAQAVKDGQLKLIPESHAKIWFAWMENIRDWCISRQLWWGHRIPAYRLTLADEPLTDHKGEELWVSAKDEDGARAKLASANIPGINVADVILKQDEDVLDTWFSSALVPFASLGWPRKTLDFGRFYPNTFLETGHDILFFWVARMVFMAQTLTGKLPFTEVYLHAMVRDAHGRKMSKSLGNIIDPMDVIHGITLEALNQQLLAGNLDPSEIEKAKKGQASDFPNGIPECGTDALRFALCAYTAQGRDINLDVNRIVGYRYFCNKIWNSAKFILNSLGDDFESKIKLEDVIRQRENVDVVDRWIIDRLGVTVRRCGEGFLTYDFQAITTALHNFWLYEFCDIYIEYTKAHLYHKVRDDRTGENGAVCDDQLPDHKNVMKSIMLTCLTTFLKLLHPLMPYISEELHQRIGGYFAPGEGWNLEGAKIDSISIARYPEASQFAAEDMGLQENVTFAMSLIKGIRAVRSDYNLPKAPLDVLVVCDVDDTRDVLCPFTTMIGTLASPLNSLDICTKAGGKESLARNSVSFNVSGRCSVFVPLKGLVDMEKEILKLKTKRDKIEDTWRSLATIMSDPNYVLKVDDSVHEQNDKKVAQYKNELEEITKLIQNLSHQ